MEETWRISKEPVKLLIYKCKAMYNAYPVVARWTLQMPAVLLLPVIMPRNAGFLRGVPPLRAHLDGDNVTGGGEVLGMNV